MNPGEKAHIYMCVCFVTEDYNLHLRALTRVVYPANGAPSKQSLVFEHL